MGKREWASQNLSEEDKEELVKDLFRDDDEGIGLVHAAQFEEGARELVKKWGTYQGIQTGIREVDNLTKGLVDGELIIIAGETSHGKTLLSINMATAIAEQGLPVLFVTLEMTFEQMTARLIKTTSSGKIPDVLYQDKDELNWKDVDALIYQAKEEGVKCVFVDHLHYFTRELEKVSEDLGRITKEFKKNAIRHGLPIVLISHVRKKEQGRKTSASNDELRGSSYIAQDADIVLFVQRETETRTKITITKNRNRGFNPDLASYEVEIVDGAKIKGRQGSTTSEENVPDDHKEIIAEVREAFPQLDLNSIDIKHKP